MKSMFYANRKDGYVYIVRDDIGNLKVGAAFNVKTRMRSLKIKYKGAKLQLVAEIRSTYFMYLERFLHIALEQHRVRGEWFYCESESNIFSVIIEFIKNHGDIFGVSYIAFLSPINVGKS